MYDDSVLPPVCIGDCGSHAVPTEAQLVEVREMRRIYSMSPSSCLFNEFIEYVHAHSFSTC